MGLLYFVPVTHKMTVKRRDNIGPGATGFMTKFNSFTFAEYGVTVTHCPGPNGYTNKCPHDVSGSQHKKDYHVPAKPDS